MTTPSDREIVVTPLSDVPRYRPEEHWGPWRLQPRSRALVIQVDSAYRYKVALDHCLDSAGCLDWIAQVAGKAWATPEVVKGLVVALDDVLDLQGALCPMGRPGSLTPPDLRERVRAFALRYPAVTRPASRRSA